MGPNKCKCRGLALIPCHLAKRGRGGGGGDGDGGSAMLSKFKFAHHREQDPHPTLKNESRLSESVIDNLTFPNRPHYLGCVINSSLCTLSQLFLKK